MFYLVSVNILVKILCPYNFLKLYSNLSFDRHKTFEVSGRFKNWKMNYMYMYCSTQPCPGTSNMPKFLPNQDDPIRRLLVSQPYCRKSLAFKTALFLQHKFAKIRQNIIYMYMVFLVRSYLTFTILRLI